MKSTGFYILMFAIPLVLSLQSCKKDDDDDASNNGCTLPNGSLQWTINGQSNCANASLFGDYAILMTINGISQQGATMTLELDSIAPGTYQMKELVNSVIYTDSFGMAWQSTDGNPGTITVTTNNTSTNRFEATFNVTLQNPLGLNQTITGGSVQVYYTE